jgi:hypothetical protein
MVNKTCGNGWLKVFNVYAKLLYAIDKNFNCPILAPTWQNIEIDFCYSETLKQLYYFLHLSYQPLSKPYILFMEKLIRSICY